MIESKEFRTIQITEFLADYEEFERIVCKRYNHRSRAIPLSDRIALFAIYRGR